MFIKRQLLFEGIGSVGVLESGKFRLQGRQAWTARKQTFLSSSLKATCWYSALLLREAILPKVGNHSLP